jgi:hypothetical protein
MKKTSIDTTKNDKRFELLRELLLEDDREKLKALSDEIMLREKLAQHVTPLVDEKIEDLRKNFPEYFGGTITETIKYQIQNSQDEVIDALYPIMGKLIKKSIVTEIAKLNEKINITIKESFSFKGKIKKFFSKKRDINDGDIVLQDVFKPVLEEVFIIEKDSGLLKGSYSTEKTADKDMVSGMLTAIKSFAEDAFFKEGQNLEDIKFETFQLSLHNFKTIYIAIATSGPTNTAFNEELRNDVFNLAEVILKDRIMLDDESKLNILIKKFVIKED